MRLVSRWLGIILLFFAQHVGAAERIISLDAVITEILYHLEEGDRLIAVESSSKYLPNSPKLPDVGYKRNLSAEGVLALAPDLLLITDDAGPPQALEQLAAAGVKISMIPTQPSLEDLRETVRAVAAEVDRATQGDALIASIDDSLAKAQNSVAKVQSSGVAMPRVLFLLTVGSGVDMSAGQGTVPDTVIRLAGGDNVMHGSLTGYKPISSEAVVATAPDVILVTQRNFDSLGGQAGILQRVGLAATPAGQAGRIIVMDGLLLTGLGPRTGQAIEYLARQLYQP